MRLQLPLLPALAWRFARAGRRQRFAAWVATLATLGIAVGVAALIIVSAVMQGLQSRLKQAVLTATPHVVVTAPPAAAERLLTYPDVIAVVPYCSGQALLQAGSRLELVELYAVADEDLRLRAGISPAALGWTAGPRADTYGLTAPADLLLRLGLPPHGSVRAFGTRGARYTPLGLLPVMRVFSMDDFTWESTVGGPPRVRGNFRDLRQFFRAPADESCLRLYLRDPFAVAGVVAALRGDGYDVSDWRETCGDFFRAVALENVATTLMLCLIIVVAAFNILSALAMTVSTRMREIAILKSLGLDDRRVCGIFLCLGGGCGIVGAALGTLCGIPLALHAQFILRLLGLNLTGGEPLPAVIDPTRVTAIVGGSLLLTLLCAVYPARRAAAVLPAVQLSHS